MRVGQAPGCKAPVHSLAPTWFYLSGDPGWLAGAPYLRNSHRIPRKIRNPANTPGRLQRRRPSRINPAPRLSSEATVRRTPSRKAADTVRNVQAMTDCLGGGALRDRPAADVNRSLWYGGASLSGLT